MSQPVCLITGAGDGTGAAIARRFAAGGFCTALLARSEDRLLRLENEIQDARGYVCDVSDLDHFKSTMAKVKAELGAPRVAIHNAVKAVFNEINQQTPEFGPITCTITQFFVQLQGDDIVRI